MIVAWNGVWFSAGSLNINRWHAIRLIDSKFQPEEENQTVAEQKPVYLNFSPEIYR